MRHFTNLYYREIFAVLAAIAGLTLLNDIRTGRLGVQGFVVLLTIVCIYLAGFSLLWAYLRASRGPAS